MGSGPTKFTAGQGKRIKAAFIAAQTLRESLIKGDTAKAVISARIIRQNRDVFDAAGILIEREMQWLDTMEAD
jgi:hypothetical protein